MITRREAQERLRALFEPHEQVEHLIDWLLDAWETSDFLTQLVGCEQASAFLLATASSEECTLSENLVASLHELSTRKKGVVSV